MAISDAQFSQWLKSDSPRVVLAEMQFAYESGGAPVEGTVYLGTRTYVTRPYDSPANVAYRDAIRGLPNVRMEVDPGEPGGITKVSVGELTLSNADGALDFLLDLIIDGRGVTFYLGDPAWPRSDFRVALAVVAEAIAASGDDTLRVTLRDKRLLLDRELAGDVVNDERRKPLVFCSSLTAFARAVEPVLDSAVDLTYFVVQNYTATTSGSYPPAFDTSSGVEAVYDNGVCLDDGDVWTATQATLTVDAGTDTLTKTAHGLAEHDVVRFDAFSGTYFLQGVTEGQQYWVISAGLTADNFRLSETKGGSAVNLSAHSGSGSVSCARKRYFDSLSTDGKIQLSTSPAGRLTVDVRGFPVSYDASAQVPGELIRALIIDYAGVDSADVEAAGFQEDVFGTIFTTEQNAALAIPERANMLSVIEAVARVSQTHVAIANDGTWFAFRANLSALSGATADHELPAAAVFGPPSVANRPIVVGTVVLNSRRNHRPLTFGELAASVSDADKRAYSAEFRESGESAAPTGTAYSTNWQGFHLTATRIDLDGAFDAAVSGGGSGLERDADEILGDLKPHLRLVQVETDLRAYDWRLGDVVEFTYPRYGFDDGVNCRLIGWEPDLVAERVRLTLLTKITPDYTTASYA